MLDILVTGFPYVRERYFATWRTSPEPERYHFVLPKVWPIKNGKIVYTAPIDPRVIPTTTLFTHSHFPIIGGLLKGWMPAFPLHLWRLRKKVGVVYACSEPALLSTLYFAIWSKIFGKKFICASWENIPYEELFYGANKWIHLGIIKSNLFLADGMVAGNKEGVQIHRNYTNKPIEQCSLNGTDQHFFTPNSQMRSEKIFRDYHWSGKLVYVFIGAIEYHKGVHIAVRAFSGVHKQFPRAILVIAGTGADEPYLQKEIDKLGIRESVVRMPWLDDKGVRDLMAVSDIFLYPSIPRGGWAEQFGYAMAEASLMELPILSTRSGSIASVVVDGVTGILVEPNNEEVLTAAMIRLGNDSELRRSLGAAGRRYVVERFSHEAIARKFHDFFSLVNRKSPHA